MQTIRIGTRRSMLALAQTELVASALRRLHPGITFEIVPIVTTGDKVTGSLMDIGGKGLFTQELETALREGAIHLAVHSGKDLPSDMSEDFAIAAVPPREDPRDALVSRGGCELSSLPPGAIVGTSSLRRAAQLRAIRKDLRVVPLRGNIETRLRKLFSPQEFPPDKEEFRYGPMDAIVLAMAGLNRGGLMGRWSEFVFPMAVEQFIPAAAQGCLVVQALAGEKRCEQIAAALDDSLSRETLLAERWVLQEIGAGCHSSIAVHVAPGAGPCNCWRGRAMASDREGSQIVTAESSGSVCSDLAVLLLEGLTDGGAERFFVD